MNIKLLLQKLLQNNSEALNDLYQDFQKKYPTENNIQHLLMSYIYSENQTNTLEKNLENSLRYLLEKNSKK